MAAGLSEKSDTHQIVDNVAKTHLQNTTSNAGTGEVTGVRFVGRFISLYQNSQPMLRYTRAVGASSDTPNSGAKLIDSGGIGRHCIEGPTITEVS